MWLTLLLQASEEQVGLFTIIKLKILELMIVSSVITKGNVFKMVITI